MREAFDLVIVGAGPAGASCAKRAGELGLSTLVLEAATFPRRKPCAAGLTSRVLDLAGGAVEACLHDSVRTLRLSFGSTTVVWEGDAPILRTTTRREFDSVLADEAASAGATLEFGAAVDDVREERGGVSVRVGQSVYRGTFAVAADGSRSRVAKRLWQGRPRQFGAVYVRAFPPAAAGLEPHRGVVTFDATATRRGYGWVFPKSDHVNAGVFAQRPLGKELTSDLRSFLGSAGLTGWRVEGPFAAPIPGSLMPGGPARGRVLLAGDSAGLADPITGEGISHAMASGRIAAEAVADALGTGGGPAAAYARRVRDEVVPHLDTARLVGRVVYCVGPHWLRVLARVPLARWAVMALHSSDRGRPKGGSLRVEQTQGTGDKQ